MNFNPRSRVGNDEGNTSGASGIIAFQSTFPRGERRQGNPGNFTVQAISIHVPAWGTTELLSVFADAFKDFNPRSRVGNDNLEEKDGCSRGNFNPRSRVGNDRHGDCGTQILTPFQSTFPRGERRKAGQRTRSRHHNFNPRSRVGNDCDRILSDLLCDHFNPRSRVGNDGCMLPSAC